MPSLEILQEGERRGLLNDQQKSLLAEARRRGIGETPPPSFMQKGGFVDRNLLSGGLPAAGFAAGSLFGGIAGLPIPAPGSTALGGVVGAGLGQAGGQNLQDALRQLLKFDQQKSIGENLQSAGSAGLQGAMIEAGGQATALPFIGGANPLTLRGPANNFKGLLPKIAELISNAKIPQVVRTAIEEFNPLGIPVGSFFKANRELGQEASQAAFKASEAARKSSYDIGVNALKEDFRIQEAARRAALKTERQVAQEAVKTLPDSTGAALRVDAGSNLSKAINIADENLQKEVGKVVTPILNKNASSVISVEPIRKEIVNILKENDLIDASGNILKENVDSIISPQRKQLMDRLIKISENIISNPTVSGLNRSVKDLQSLANFGGLNRSAEDKVFGSLSRVAKESLYDGLEQIVGPDASNAIRSVRKTFSENQPIFDTLRAIADKAPEQIVDSARNALPGTFILETISKQPALKKPIADVVLNDLARSFSSPKTLQTVINKYGPDSLSKLLSPQTYQSLLTAQEALIKSSRPFVSGRAPVPIPFVEGELTNKLSPFWKKQISRIQAGESLTEPSIKALFQAIGKITATGEN